MRLFFGTDGLSNSGLVVWKQSDVTHRRFYWLAVDAKDELADAEVKAHRAG
jgi:hypothetical protein